jgi:hypothetical protein
MGLARVTASIVGQDGAPANGTATFTPTHEFVDPSSGALVDTAPIISPIDAGVLSTLLYATQKVTGDLWVDVWSDLWPGVLTDLGVAYDVTLSIGDLTTSFRLSVPPWGVDLATVAALAGGKGALVNLTGFVVDADGIGAAGQVEFLLTEAMRGGAALPEPVVCPLTGGHFSVNLVSTDDPAVGPVRARYAYYERIVSEPADPPARYFVLPHGASPVDIGTLLA